MSYPWQTNANMGFKSVPVLRAMWTHSFKSQYLRSLHLTAIMNNLYRINNHSRVAANPGRLERSLAEEEQE